MQLGSVLIVLGAVTLSLAKPLEAPNCRTTTNNLTGLTLGNDPMSNKPEDVSFNCSDYVHFLTPAQMDLCERKDKDYLPCMALGIKRAIQWCQKVFKDNYWNCTNWVGDYVFGKIVHRFATKERAVVVAMVTAGITVDIATCCRERRLKDCPCVFPNWRRRETVDDEGKHVVLYADCSDNVEIAKERTEQIMGVVSENYMRSGQATVEDKVDYHNAALGTRLGMRTVEVCRCHGLTGQCNVKTCKHLTVEYEEIAEVMPAKYQRASEVSVNSTGKLESAGPEDDPTSNDLVYSCKTPFTCLRNEGLGIPGTSGRECNSTNTMASNYCGTFCCGRGYYSVSTTVPVKECKFVYCCYRECTVVRKIQETRHYCR